MGAFKGVADKAGHRTVREEAIRKGTNPKGFTEAMPYNYQAGHPVGDGVSDAQATVTMPQVKQDAPPVDGIDPTPFVMKG